jgi:hypothetical protein
VHDVSLSTSATARAAHATPSTPGTHAAFRVRFAVEGLHSISSLPLLHREQAVGAMVEEGRGRCYELGRGWVQPKARPVEEMRQIFLDPNRTTFLGGKRDRLAVTEVGVGLERTRQRSRGRTVRLAALLLSRRPSFPSFFPILTLRLVADVRGAAPQRAEV